MAEKNEEKVDDIDTKKDDVEDEEIEEVDLDLDDEGEDGDDEDLDPDELKKQNKTLKAQKNHWRDKYKALQGAKDDKGDKKPTKPTEKAKTPTLTPLDLYALMGAKVPEDDVEEVVKAAKLLGKSVPEALKEPLVKGLLKERQEMRDTENAASTKHKGAGTKKITDEQVAEKARKGELPEPGSTEAEQLYWARRGGRRS